MSLSPSDLIYPTGEIRPEWFAGDTQAVVVVQAAAPGAVVLAVAPLLGAVAAGAVLAFGGVSAVVAQGVARGEAVVPVGALSGEVRAGESAYAPLALTDALAGWIASGYIQAPAEASTAQGDAVARAVAHVRAYDAKAAQMAANPDSVNLDGLAVTTSVGRVNFFRDKANEWRGVLTAALAAAVPAPPPAPARVSHSVRSEFTW